jgi:hypothetical protein
MKYSIMIGNFFQEIKLVFLIWLNSKFRNEIAERKIALGYF